MTAYSPVTPAREADPGRDLGKGPGVNTGTHQGADPSESSLGSKPSGVTRARLRQEVADSTDWGVVRAVLDVGIIVLCVALALVPMLPAYDSPWALGAIIAGALSGVAPVVMGVRLRWPFVLTLVVVFFTYVVVGGALAFRSELVAGFVPSGRSISAMLSGLVTSWMEALTLEPPLGASHGVLILPFLMALLGAVAVTFLVLRRRSWPTTLVAVCVPFVLFAAAILWGTAQSVIPRGLGILLALILVVWASWRMNTWRPSRALSLGGILATALAGALVLTPLVQSDHQRTVLRAVVVPPFDLEDQISPLSTYRQFIKDYSETPLLTVSGLPQGTPVRLATMDQFDGVVWDVSSDGNRAGSGSFRRIGDEVPQSLTGQKYSVSLQVGDLRGVWTPTIGYLTSIAFDDAWLGADFRLNDATGAGVMPGGLSPDLRYTLTGVIPDQPTDEELGQAGVGSIDVAPATQIPEIVADRASAISREGATVPLVVRKFEEYLANGGYFSHGEQVDGFPSLSGHGTSRIADLFAEDQMIGDAEQYASAMALMARSQGIPSRVVMGFLPEPDQGGDVTFTGADMTAWTEVFYDDFGWVSYFPTPDESRTPSKSQETAKPSPQPESIQDPPDPQPSVSPPAVDTEETNVAADDEQSGTPIDWARVLKVSLAVGIPVFVLLLGPLLVVAAKAGRRNSRRSAEGREQVLGGWQEFVDAAHDLGIRPPAELTRRETARFIEAGNPEAHVLPLADGADVAQFGYDELEPTHGADYWSKVDRAIVQIGARTSRWRKLRAKLSLGTFPLTLRRKRASS